VGVIKDRPETTVHGETCYSTLTHYPNSNPSSLCSYSFKVRSWHSNLLIMSRTWWKLFHKRVMRTKFGMIYAFITITGLIPLLVDY